MRSVLEEIVLCEGEHCGMEVDLHWATRGLESFDLKLLRLLYSVDTILYRFGVFVESDAN